MKKAILQAHIQENVKKVIKYPVKSAAQVLWCVRKANFIWSLGKENIKQFHQLVETQGTVLC